MPLKAGCPEVIQQMQSICKKLIDPQLRNTLQTDMVSLGSQVGDPDDHSNEITSGRLMTTLPEELIIALREKQVATIINRSACYSHSTVTIHGLTYSTNKKHRGNSCAIILSPSKHPLPVQIIHILQFIGDDDQITTYLGVRRHKKSPFAHDPYLKYPLLGAAIWDIELERLEIVEANNIISHFACLPLQSVLREEKAICAIPLWK